MNKISKHITFQEAIRSNTALRHGIPNIPDKQELDAMINIAEKVFEPLRASKGVPIRVSSFYRSRLLSQFTSGSSLTSQHIKGEAIDLQAMNNSWTNREIFEWILDNIEFDQLIWEYGTNDEPAWVHVSMRNDGTENRNQVLIKKFKQPYKPYSHVKKKA